MNLLTTQNSKTSKGEKLGILTGIIYLKPEKSGGFQNVCPAASDGCAKACLNSAGRGAFDQVQAGRQRKTELLFQNPALFYSLLRSDIKALVRKAKREGFAPAVRINGTSDMPSVARRMAKEFPELSFYDYTKLAKPYARTLPNYHITFSRSENNWAECVDALENGINVAAVFLKVPKRSYKGYKVINGDELNGDYRPADEKYKRRDGKGVIIALKAKQDAKYDLTGFVIMTKAERAEIPAKLAAREKRREKARLKREKAALLLAGQGLQ